MDPENKKFGKGPRELTGAVDLISYYKLLPHHDFFCKKSLPLSISDTHYLHNVAGDSEIRKGEGMQLDQLIQNTSFPRDINTRIQPFDLDTLREAFQLRETAPVDLLSLGYDIDEKELNDLFWRFKSFAEMKKVITDDDLVALVSEEVFQPQVVWKFGDVHVTCGKEHIACFTGTGPVDAAYKAVDIIMEAYVKLLEYSMSAVTAGIDAIASTRVVIDSEDNRTSTHASREKNVAEL